MRRRALPTRKKRGFANSYEQRNMSSPITTSQVSRAQARPVQVGTRDAAGSTLINHWQRGVPVYREPVLRRYSFSLARWPRWAGTGRDALLLSAWPLLRNERCLRLGNLEDLQRHDPDRAGLGPARGGHGAWVFNRRKLHVVMRTALVSGFLFYATGLFALGFDVGRPWNFYSFLLPWRWNAESAMLEISICMPLYCAVFLLLRIFPWSSSGTTTLARTRPGRFCAASVHFCARFIHS